MQIFDVYHALKVHLVNWTGQSQAMMAINAGLAVYLLCQVGLGTRRGSSFALAMVGVADAFNVVMDRLYFGTWHWAEGLNGTVLILMWPVMLTAASKFRRSRWNLQNKPVKRRRKTHQRVSVANAALADAATPANAVGRPHLRVIPGYGSDRARG